MTTHMNTEPEFIADPESLAKAIETMRIAAVFEDEEEKTVQAGPQAAQFFLLAMAALEQAARFAKLAEYARRRGE